MNTPYGIFEYSVNNFCAYLSYQTNTNFSYVRQQITYIDNYLTSLAKESNLCFIYENDYIDKNYIDDFSNYYVKCFSAYKKTTSRIHFFKYTDTKNLKDEFKSALNNKETIFNNDNYLGFIVIRPIPKTFLAKVCLKPFHINNNRIKKYYILKNYKVSLFGIILNIQSIAFQEQDKILSACATTSLWSFYHAHHNSYQNTFPSSSEITKSAYPELNGHSREFPNNGLSTEMICRSLRYYKLSPEYFELTENKKQRLQESIYAYCSSNIPIILGVSVCDENGKTKGLHAITILGYSITQNQSTNLIAHGLENIYVHDDRYGPFIKMILNNDEFKVQLHDNFQTKIFDSNEIYKVDTLILGLYHKIRIPYIPIKNTCLILCKNLITFIQSLEGTNNKLIQGFIKLLKNLKWDISIKQNSDFKTSLLNKNLNNKEIHLTKALPKYLWCATALIEDIAIFDLIFDATDIEQGNVFIDYLSYSDTEYGENIYAILKKYSKLKIEETSNHIDILDEMEDNYLNGILHYCNKEQTYKDSLDEIFGYLKIPKLIKSEEIKDNVINDSKIFRENFQSSSNFNLEDNSEYIWLIDKEGFLCIGIEKSSNGHPTLNNGMPARIGGELKQLNPNTWEINSKSGRYSSDYSQEEQDIFLNNAVRYKFHVIFPEITFTLQTKI